MAQTSQPINWTPAPKQSSIRLDWVWLLAALAAVYAISTFLVPKINDGWLELYVVRPFLWLSVSGLVVWLWRRNFDGETFPLPKPVIVTAALFGLTQVAISTIVGVFVGFGHSPYARGFLLMALNLWYVATQLAGIELARWYLVKRLGRKNVFTGVLLAWLVITLVMIPWGSFRQFGDVKSAFEVTGKTILPIASTGLLATFFAFVGGPVAAMGYRGVLLLVEWTAPILPDLSWIVSAFVGTLVPVVGIMAVFGLYMNDEETASATEEKQSSGEMFGWLLVALFAVLMIGFNTGIFGVQPNLVSGFSMKPTFVAGDVVVSRQVAVDSLQVHDMIRFRQHGVWVLHRIIDIQTDENGQKTFITQGDNNNDPDPAVKPEQISGKIILIVPKLGWLSIWLREVTGFGKVYN